MTSQVRGVSTSQVPEWDAETAVRQAYLINVVVYRCIQINAEKIASLPFRVGPKLPDRPGETAEFKVDAPLARLLGPEPEGPNPDTSSEVLWAHSIAQYLATGRFGWEVEWSGKPGASKVVGLWPLISQYLRPIPTNPEDPKQKGISTNRYFGRFEYQAGMQQRSLSREQCYYDWRPSLTDWMQPESPLQAARLDVGVAVMQDIYDNAFLKNGGIPAHIIITEAFAEDAERRAFRDQFNSRFQGPSNAGRNIFSEVQDGSAKESVEVKTIGLSQKDSEAIARHRGKLESIAMAFGVPFSKLDASKRTFDNAEAEDITWEMETIVPLASRLGTSVNRRLAPLAGSERGWFDLSGLKCFAKKKQYLSVSPIEARDAKVISTDEAREVLGEEPIGESWSQEIPDASLPAPQQPVALQPATQVEPVTKTSTSLPGGTRADEPSTALTEPQPEGNGSPLGTGVADRVVDPPAPFDHEARRARIWRSVDAQVTTLEGTWQTSFIGLFLRQERAVLANLNGKRGKKYAAENVRENPPPPEDMFDPEFWQKETDSMSVGLYSSVAALAAGRLIDQFDTPINMNSEVVQSFIRTRANELAGQITDTTYRQIKAAMLEGVKNGEGIDKLAVRIQHVFKVAYSGLENQGGRARMIARTEVISAYNGSTFVIGVSLDPDIVGGREWIATRDQRVRDSHRDADGQVAIGSEPFTVGGYKMRFPGDGSAAPASEVIQCRCTLGWLTPDEIGDRSKATVYLRVEDVEQELLRIALDLYRENRTQLI